MLFFFHSRRMLLIYLSYVCLPVQPLLNASITRDTSVQAAHCSICSTLMGESGLPNSFQSSQSNWSSCQTCPGQTPGELRSFLDSSISLPGLQPRCLKSWKKRFKVIPAKYNPAVAIVKLTDRITLYPASPSIHAQALGFCLHDSGSICG